MPLTQSCRSLDVGWGAAVDLASGSATSAGERREAGDGGGGKGIGLNGSRSFPCFRPGPSPQRETPPWTISPACLITLDDGTCGVLHHRWRHAWGPSRSGIQQKGTRPTMALQVSRAIESLPPLLPRRFPRLGTGSTRACEATRAPKAKSPTSGRRDEGIERRWRGRMITMSDII